MVTLGILGLIGGLAGLVYGSMQLKEGNASFGKVLNSDMMKHHLYQGKKLWKKDLEEIEATEKAEKRAELREQLAEIKKEDEEAAKAEEAKTEEVEAETAEAESNVIIDGKPVEMK